MPGANNPCLGALPDDLLLTILGPDYLTTMERLSSPVLVCKRWHQLCHTPQLLRSLRIEFSRYSRPKPDAYLLRLQSLQHWLASHSQHVRSLHLSAPNAHPDLNWLPETVSFGDDITPGAIVERAALAACLQLCTQLEQLTVGNDTRPMGVDTDEAADWLLSMPCLRRLNHLGDPEQLLHLPPGLSGLQQLEHADLGGAGIVLHDLPRSLTSLQLYDTRNPEELPEQLATLPQLQRLCLYCYENIDTRSGSASCTRLASLSMLTHLCLVETCIPAADCLGRLPHLRQLAIETGQVDSAADREQLESALARCQQLTLLALNVQFTQELADPEDWDPLLRIPRSVARLHNLRALLFSIECYGSARIDTSLPAGPWLQSLRWLALPWSMAMQQAGTLAAGALALRRLFLSAPPMATAADDFEKAYAHHLPAFESLVADHPALEFVGYVGKHRYSQSWLPDQLVNLLTRLAAQRPGLTVAESPSARFPSDLSYFPAFLEEPHLFGIPFRG